MLRIKISKGSEDSQKGTQFNKPKKNTDKNKQTNKIAVSINSIEKMLW